MRPYLFLTLQITGAKILSKGLLIHMIYQRLHTSYTLLSYQATNSTNYTKLSCGPLYKVSDVPYYSQGIPLTQVY